MHPAVAGLVGQEGPVEAEAWRSFWDELDAGRLDRAEPVALLASLATRLPGPETLGALLASLDERRPAPPVRLSGAVNVVGTGGGPRTFNVSTAAAIVAAAAGVPVVKTGSRAYAGGRGSIDLLDRLGVRLTQSHAETAEVLGTHGIAFTGHYVYPRELTRLARRIVPIGLRPFGRVLNAIGPFLASVPVSAQVTGVSDRSLLPVLRSLAAGTPDRAVWLCSNELGVDELLGFAANVVDTGAEPVAIGPGRFTGATGALADLRPAAESDVVDHFLAVLAGGAGEVATDTVCLNAAALAVATGGAGWARAVADAREAVRSGAARALADRLRTGVGARTGAGTAVRHG
jgi:anthranilate phosphoribosyltransferase